MELISAKQLYFKEPRLIMNFVSRLVRTSGGQYLSAADAFMSVMNRGDFQVVGYCAPDVFKKDIETKKDFVSLFDVIRVEESSEEESIELLSYFSLILEDQYKVDISFKAMKRAVQLSHRYFREKLLPQSAEDLLKETLSFVKNKGEKELTEDDVVQVCQQKLNVPLSETTEVEAESLLNLEDKIHERLIDQEEAVKAVSRSLREYRAGLSRTGGPIPPPIKHYFYPRVKEYLPCVGIHFYAQSKIQFFLGAPNRLNQCSRNPNKESV